jgi:hypothetical protein
MRMIGKLWNCVAEYLARTWRLWIDGIRSRVAIYRRRKAFLILDASLYCLLLGVLAYMFLVVPSLDMEGRKHAGLAIITLIVISTLIYSELKKYILSKSQRKLTQWNK